MKLNAITTPLILGILGSTLCMAQDELPWGEIESKQWANALGQIEGIGQRPSRVTPVKTDPALTTVTHAYGRFNSLPAVEQVAPVTDHWKHRPVRGAEATFDGLRARRIRYKDEAAAKEAGQQLINMMTDPSTASRLSKTKAPVVVQVRGNEVVVLEGPKLSDPKVLKSVKQTAWDGKNPNSAATNTTGTFGTPDANGVRAFAIDTDDGTGAIAQNAARTQDAVNTMSEDSPGFRRYADFAFEESSPNGDVAQIMQTEHGPVSILMAPSTESATEVDKLARVADGRRRDPLEALDTANKGNQQLVGTIDGDKAVVLVRDEDGNVERRVGSADGETYDFQGEVKPLDADQQKLMQALQGAGWLKDDVTVGLAPENEDTLILKPEEPEVTTIAQGSNPAEDTVVKQGEADTKPTVDGTVEGGADVIKDLSSKMDGKQDETETKPAETDTVTKQDETETKPAETDTVTKQDETETKPAETDTVTKQDETETKPAETDTVTKQDETETKPAETDTVTKQDETETQPAETDTVTKQDETETKPAETDTVTKQDETETKPAETTEVDGKKQDETETKPAETTTVVAPTIVPTDPANPDDQKPAVIDDKKQDETETKPAETTEIDGKKQDETETKPAETTEVDGKKQDETETKPAETTEIDGKKQDETETKPAETTEIDGKKQDETETKPAETEVVAPTDPANPDDKKKLDDAATRQAEMTEKMMDEIRASMLDMEKDRAATEEALKTQISNLETKNKDLQAEVERRRSNELYGTDPLTFPSYDRTRPVYDPLTGTYRQPNNSNWLAPDSFRRPNDFYDWRNGYRNGLDGYNNQYDPFSNNNSFGSFGNDYNNDRNNPFSGDNSTKSGFDEAVKLSEERKTKKMELIRDLEKENNELIRKLGSEKAKELLSGEEATVAETNAVDRPYAGATFADSLSTTGLLRVTPGPLNLNGNKSLNVTVMKAGIIASASTIKRNAKTGINFQGGVQGGKGPYTFTWSFPGNVIKRTQNAQYTFFGTPGQTHYDVILLVVDSKQSVSQATYRVTIVD